MTVESATYINSLNALWPLAGDSRAEGDDHIRLVKAAIKATWANVTGAVTATHTQMNHLVGVTSAIQTQLDAKGAVAGQTWTGTHNFSGGTTQVATAAEGTSSTTAASTAFVNTYFARQPRRVAASVGAGSTTLNLNNAEVFTVNPGGSNLTISLSSVPAAGKVGAFIIEFTAGSAGGAVITYWGTITWQGGAAPALSSTGRDLIGFITHDGGTTWTGVPIAQNPT